MTRTRVQSATVYRFYQKSMKDMNEQFMVENRLTQIIFPKFEMESGVTELQPCAADDWEEYKKLCTKLNIVPPTMMQKEMCQHYVLKKNQRIIAGMSIMTANINGSNMRICSSIELLVSNVRGCASTFIRFLSKNIKKRVGTSYMVTQALDSDQASGFWYKHMARHREADALTFMFFMLDKRYKLFEGVTNLRNTF